MSFRVDLDIFRGPLDLLLYLVRKHEVEVVEIPIAAVTEQFLGYLQLLQELDVNAVGDFLDMASTLVELKSRLMLPNADEVADPLDDPRQELVRRLLEYKEFKDAATILEDRARAWQERFPRWVDDAPLDPADAELPLEEVEVWDLVSAFARVLRERQTPPPSSIVYDDTPLHVYMGRLQGLLADRARVPLSELFRPGMHRSALVGLFLAVLELVRDRGARAEQNSLYGEIWIVAAQPPTVDESSPADEQS
jgi:segregation and condensation protein A